MNRVVCASFVGLVGGSLLLPHGAAAQPAAPTQRPYQAQSIWCGAETPQPFQFVRFRKTVELAARPASATAYITADTFYRLWVNAQLAMHGPARSSRGKATVDPVAVGHLLVPGRNALVVEVFHGVCAFEALAQAPGLFCELEAESRDRARARRRRGRRQSGGRDGPGRRRHAPGR